MYRRTGFTLIELLVIAAIVTILAATLFPVFAQARSSARTATAITEFKQRGQAIVMYAQDYDEAFPRRQTTLRTAGFKASPKPEPRPIETGCINDPDPTLWQSLNGGCQDMQANLVWSRTSHEATGFYNRVFERAPGDTRLAGAREYCRDLVEGGFEDWRLPTKDEVAVAASHQISAYISIFSPDGWGRWAEPGYYKGKDLYAYMAKLGTGTATAVVARTKSGSYPNSMDTICVRTP
jgi:type II secretory pathway pseudopilin PulG